MDSDSEFDLPDFQAIVIQETAKTIATLFKSLKENGLNSEDAALIVGVLVGGKFAQDSSDSQPEH